MMVQHLALLCSWNSVIHFIPFHFNDSSDDVMDSNPSWVVINDFKVLLPHQHTNQSNVLIVSMLTIVVDLTAARPGKLGIQRALWQPRCPVCLTIKPFFRTWAADFFKEPSYLSHFIFQLSHLGGGEAQCSFHLRIRSWPGLISSSWTFSSIPLLCGLVPSIYQGDLSSSAPCHQFTSHWRLLSVPGCLNPVLQSHLLCGLGHVTRPPYLWYLHLCTEREFSLPLRVTFEDYGREYKVSGT